jgi:hypothetical protein
MAFSSSPNGTEPRRASEVKAARRGSRSGWRLSMAGDPTRTSTSRARWVSSSSASSTPSTASMVTDRRSWIW